MTLCCLGCNNHNQFQPLSEDSGESDVSAAGSVDSVPATSGGSVRDATVLAHEIQEGGVNRLSWWTKVTSKRRCEVGMKSIIEMAVDSLNGMKEGAWLMSVVQVFR